VPVFALFPWLYQYRMQCWTHYKYYSFFFFVISSTYIAVYSKQSAQYSKLHLFIPDGHKEDSEFAGITLRAGVDGSVNHRHVNMRGC